MYGVGCGMFASRPAAVPPGVRAERGDASAQGDVIVVLGCRVGADGELGPAGRRRVAAAARAWRAQAAPRVIVSGGRRWEGHAEADAMQRALLAAGVPPAAVTRELCSLSTLENAWYSARVMQALGARRAVVVSCDWHLPRALACFASVGVSATGLAARGPSRDPFQRLARQLREQLSLHFELGVRRGMRAMRGSV